MATYLPRPPRSLKRMMPLTLANRVSSLPRPTFRPGLMRVPRGRLGFVFGLGRRRGFRCVGRLGLLGFRLVAGLEMLAVEGDLGNAHGSEGLAMSGELLVLLLALVVENQDLIGASFFDHTA